LAVVEIHCRAVFREMSNYIEGEIAPELRERMEKHFEKCRHCTAILDGTRNVVRIVGEVFPLPTNFGARLRQRLSELVKTSPET
jgi:anti-sigma factor RsiW